MKPMYNEIQQGELLVPRNNELERTILGEIIIAGSNGYIEIENIISTNSFYSDYNATVFAAFVTLAEQRKDINQMEVAQVLHAEGKLEYVGGAIFIAQLARDVASTHALVQHAEALRQCEIKRNTFIFAEKLRALAADTTSDDSEVLEFADKTITELQSSTTGQVFTIDESLSRYYEWAIDNEYNKNSVISTGLNGLDNILDGGFRAPDLIIVGGRPSMGKTAFAVQFAENFIRQGKHVLFFSLEMTDIQLINRMVAKEGLSSSHVRKGTMSAEEKAIQERNMLRLQGLRLHTACSEAHKQLTAIKSEAYRFKRKNELDIIIIDYLQYIKTKINFKGQRYLEVGYITSELKALAKDLNVPIILLAQVGRNSEGQDMEPPRMSDLRESGNIEQDADIIIFPHRPYYYNAEAIDVTGRSWKDRGVLYIAKNREGMRNVKTYFMNDEQFKEIWDDEQANEQLPHE